MTSCRPPLARRASLSLVGAFWLWLLAPAAYAAEPPTFSFDLPAEAAEQALKKFSRQSGLEVLFATESAAKVTTNAVKGRFTPKEAIGQMLGGTTLVANQDAATGAMKISRANDPNAQRAAQKTPSDRPGIQDHPKPSTNPRKP